MLPSAQPPALSRSMRFIGSTGGVFSLGRNDAVQDWCLTLTLRQGVAILSMACWLGNARMIAAVAATVIAVSGAGRVATSDATPLPQYPYIFDIAVDPADSAQVLLATRSGIYRAGPDGAAVRISVSQYRFWRLVPHPSRANVFYATGLPASGKNRGLLVSQDSGRTWRHTAEDDKAPFQFRKFDVSKAEPQVIYALRHQIRVSRDEGKHWAITGSPPGRPYDIAASSLNADTIYVGTAIGLFISTDGGRSWKTAFPWLCGQPVTVVESGADGVVYAFSICGKLIRGDERTGEWVIVNEDFGGCIIQHLAVTPLNRNVLYGVERCNRTLTSTDGGRSWKVLGSAEPGLPSCPTNPYGDSAPLDEWIEWLHSKESPYF